MISLCFPKRFLWLWLALVASVGWAQPKPGFIEIRCEPGVLVFLNGELKGATDTEMGFPGKVLENVPAGTHTLRFVKSGFDPVEDRVTVPPGGVAQKTVSPFTRQVQVLQSGAGAGTPRGVVGRDSGGADRSIPDLGLTLVWIEPGTFAMGSAQGGDRAERPVTRVTLTRGYWLGKTEVTQRQWEAVMGGNPSNLKNAGKDAPVESVSYDDALAYCRKLTERELVAGRLTEGYAYTLPTEAQWEYACRAGTTGDYAGNVDAMGWSERNSRNMTNPVGTKQANAWGLHDMHGNVWEWCLDWFAPYPGGNVTDPAGDMWGAFRVFRGGSWLDSVGFLRSAVRDGDEPDRRVIGRGFRVALSAVR
jgi:formylglycine-generating enzyme required for sulfatase activity